MQNCSSDLFYTFSLPAVAGAADDSCPKENGPEPKSTQCVPGYLQRYTSNNPRTYVRYIPGVQMEQRQNDGLTSTIAVNGEPPTDRITPPRLIQLRDSTIEAVSARERLSKNLLNRA